MSFQSGFVCIVGRPNAGKSTLMNAILGEKMAIVSNKPQTTRNKILTIYNEDDCQIVFVDTPGVHRPKTKLGEMMNTSVKEAMGDVDAALFLVEADRDVGETEKEIVKRLSAKNIPTILVINKIDLVEKERLLPLIDVYQGMMEFSSIIPVSALKKNGVNLVLKEVKALLPEGPKFYPDDMITDQSERTIVAEIIREKVLRLLDKEVPHGTAVVVDKMKEDGALVRISATIFCEKATHKGIIIGKGGAMLKRIGSYARTDIEKLLDKKVYLELWVKVKDDWRNKAGSLSDFGFGEKD